MFNCANNNDFMKKIALIPLIIAIVLLTLLTSAFYFIKTAYDSIIKDEESDD